jgi:hypothetical protein
VDGNSFRIPQYLSAGSPSGLSRLMLQNNLKYAVEFTYFDIQFAQGKWWAWFYAEIDKSKLIVQTIKGEENGSSKE